MMKLKSVKSIMNLSKRAIVMAINDQFRKMSKKQVAVIYYALLKAKLPRLKALPKRSKKQLDNDKRLGKMSKARAKKKGVKKRRRR